MDFVVKITTDYTDATLIAQFINPANLNWSRELKGTGRASFILPMSDPQIEAIKEFNKIAIYEVRDGIDELKWSGYIDEPEFDFNNALVVASDEKRFLQHKRIFEGKGWATETVTEIFDEIIPEANARSAGDGRGELSYETDLGASVPEKDFAFGTDYYTIIDAIASQLEAEWTVELNVIKLMTTIGEDKSDNVGDDFVEFVSNRNSPNENTIASFKDKRAGNSIVTSLIGKDSHGHSEQTDNTETFGHVEGFQSFPDGNLASQTLAALQANSGSPSSVNIEVNTDQIRYDQVTVGDLVQLRIEGYNAKINTQRAIKVLTIAVEVVDRIPSIKITLSDENKPVRNAANLLAKMNQRITAIELQ